MIHSAAPLVSVIIPVFNGANFLFDALDSVRAQNYRPLEIIAVDDGSTDASRQILAEASDLIVLHTDRGGVAHARNTGIARARGAFIAFLDQDDLWTDDKIAAQVGAFQEDSALGFNFVLQTFELLEGDRPAWLRPDIPPEPHPSFVPSSMMVRRSTLEVVGDFDQSLQFGSDTDWIKRAREKSVRHRIIEQVGLIKRVHGRNESGKATRALADLRTLLRASINRHRAGNDL